MTVLLFGCSNQTSIKYGKYTFVRLSKIELGYLFLTQGIKSYFVGCELILQKDSTFKYTTCGNIMTGTWNCFRDSLFLNVTKNRWRNDSLAKNGFNGAWPQIPEKPIGFKCGHDRLVKIHILKNGERIVEELKLNVPYNSN